jgi:hypothetical protein
MLIGQAKLRFRMPEIRLRFLHQLPGNLRRLWKEAYPPSSATPPGARPEHKSARRRQETP